MQWSEVRERFPNQFVLVEELSSHIEGDIVLVDDVTVVRTVPEEEATKTLMQCMLFHEDYPQTGQEV